MLDNNGKEVFFLRMVGGPHPGTRHCTEGEDWGFIVSWPLPDELPDEGGVYKKISQSDRKERVENEHVARSAQYEWVLDGQTP